MPEGSLHKSSKATIKQAVHNVMVSPTAVPSGTIDAQAGTHAAGM